MVTLYTQLLQRKYADQLDATGTEFIHYAVQGARDMELLIKDLLAYTRVVGAAPEDVKPVSASTVLGKAVHNLKSAIQENQAVIETDSLPSLLISDVHLLQLFQNLIGNALKYRSQEPPHVRISAVHDGEMWKICICDNGIGIAPEYTKLVFGIFKRLHSGRDKYEGTGIGLAICQKIVERYGGRIWVESEGDGKGSTFCFTLPGVA